MKSIIQARTSFFIEETAAKVGGQNREAGRRWLLLHPSGAAVPSRATVLQTGRSRRRDGLADGTGQLRPIRPKELAVMAVKLQQ